MVHRFKHKNKSSKLIYTNHVCCFFLPAHIWLLCICVFLVVVYNILYSFDVLVPSIDIINFIKDNVFISYILPSLLQVGQLASTIITFLVNKQKKSDIVFKKMIKEILGKNIYNGTIFMVLFLSAISIFNFIEILYYNNSICNTDVSKNLDKAQDSFSYIVSFIIISVFLFAAIILFFSIIFNTDIDYYDRFKKYARHKFGKKIQNIDTEEIKRIVKITDSCESQADLIQILELIYRIMLEYNYSNIGSIYNSMLSETVTVIKTFSGSNEKNNGEDIARKLFSKLVNLDASAYSKQKFKMQFFLITYFLKNKYPVFDWCNNLNDNTKNEVTNILVYTYIYLNAIDEIDDELTKTLYIMIRNQIFSLKYNNDIFRSISEIFLYFDELGDMDDVCLDFVLKFDDEYSFLYFVWENIFCRNLEGE